MAITNLIEQFEEMRVVHLSHIRFVACRYACDLNMSNLINPTAQLVFQVTFDDLGVIKVTLHLQICGGNFFANYVSVVLTG